MDRLNYLATSTFGLESLVSRELGELGYEATIPSNGRIAFTAGPEAIARCNLWLRTADRVLIEVAQVPAGDFDELFEHTQALPWEQWIPTDGAFPVRGRSRKSKLTSVPACQRTVKKAIVERLLTAHRTAALPETGPSFTVEIALDNDIAALTIDTTGRGLSNRGYRTRNVPAPLRETLAAALVMLSFWQPGRPLLDPFCGSGTIVIEAAMIGRNLAPGRLRDFAAEAWPVLDPALWTDARREADDLARGPLDERLIGTDIDADVLTQARYHAAQADVADDVHFQVKPFTQLETSRPFGCLITNPPYGLRSGEQREVQDLYRSMPEIFRRLDSWSIYVLTAAKNFEALLGQTADRRRKLYNGNVETTYYQFHGPRPPQDAPRAKATPQPAPAEQAFGGLDPHVDEQVTAFANRLAKNARHLRRWPAKGITCYRLYDRDIPEVPLAVDRYEGHLHIAEYDRPHDRTPAQQADWLERMTRTAAEIMDIPPEQVFLKYRRRQKGAAQYRRADDSGYVIEVAEGGLRFEVNLSDYLDTGLFLDHRITRSLVRDAAANARVLNLFAYTGSFSVYAAAGGAKSVTTVDSTRTYLDWARRNMQRNGFTGPAWSYCLDDVMHFLRTSRDAYDLIVCDPPTFSNSKDVEVDFDIQRDHVALLSDLVDRLAPGGVIYFSTNFRRFKLDEAALPAASFREISRQTVPEDFRNRRIHRCWTIMHADDVDE
jgi:23S rRNA (guanine2445-N2)-methyltransferase / 23S rRNA (guanine2069-N7)-methyltransferase